MTKSLLCVKQIFIDCSTPNAMPMNCNRGINVEMKVICGTISNNKIPEPTYKGVTQNQNLRLFHTDKKEKHKRTCLKNLNR